MAAAIAVLLPTALAFGGERTKQQITHVLELFTSQGCSSCPPADAFLAEQVDKPHVLALSYHVDYWDYIGWRDTFGSEHNDDRQAAYAKAFANKMVYTPQLIINGHVDLVGSHIAKIERTMAEGGLATGPGAASLSVRRIGDSIHISAHDVATPPGARKPMLVLVNFGDVATVAVDRGENQGKTLVSVHPVRSWQLMGMVGAEGMEVDMPLSSIIHDGAKTYGCAVLLQAVKSDGSPGPILAATQIEIDPN
ncbi:DUF1223 domain-containing protein [Jiella sp. MQZ9-1]|uniref:DUF1223 domain-containing protein n=1 Tax=Jiella flava TaxID=2816857 RepID=A0A939FY17_9HYPH|nr:DUF1223 domain-containing protein [Jiella flava]MBO0663567.1 DUF1223 domain-containing protein [Jiella flava]MCD2472143.1 DUF1223 domain-containing protein [Jiella flava]